MLERTHKTQLISCVAAARSHFSLKIFHFTILLLYSLSLFTCINKFMRIWEKKCINVRNAIAYTHAHTHIHQMYFRENIIYVQVFVCGIVYGAKCTRKVLYFERKTSLKQKNAFQTCALCCAVHRCRERVCGMCSTRSCIYFRKSFCGEWATRR